MEAATLDWLLEGDPWVRYGTMIHLQDVDPHHPDCITTYAEMMSHPLISSLIHELESWPGKPINSHKSAGTHLHKLSFLADIGVRGDDPRFASALQQILTHQDSNGIIQILMNIPTHFGGKGIDEWAWVLCDAPTIHAALLKMGVADPLLKTGSRHMIDLVRENGWPCAGSEELGSFRGPGPKHEACPYATLLMLKNMVELDELDCPAARIGIESLLHNWEQSHERHPYIFYMGTDFRKLKFPFIWYDILHVVEVLSHFPEAWNDSRFEEMVRTITEKADSDGRYTPESIWMAWRGLDSGQKQQPSQLLTYRVERINRLKLKV